MDDTAGVVIVVGWFSLVVGLIGAILGQRAERNRAERERSYRADDERVENAARLERVEAMMEAMSVEMERVSEGQRFVTRLLAESRLIRGEGTRSPRSPIPSVSRHDSPPPTAWSQL